MDNMKYYKTIDIGPFEQDELKEWGIKAYAPFTLQGRSELPVCDMTCDIEDNVAVTEYFETIFGATYEDSIKYYVCSLYYFEEQFSDSEMYKIPVLKMNEILECAKSKKLTIDSHLTPCDVNHIQSLLEVTSLIEL